MKWIREILGRVFALWAAIVFIGSLIVIYIPILVMNRMKEPKRTIYIFKIFNTWMTFFFIFSGVKRRIVGRSHFEKGENYVVVCNHNSFMDVPLSSPGIPGTNKTIAKSEMAKIPIFGLIYTSGSVIVNRKSEESRRQSYLKMKEVLSMGLHMCIYPEGTRNKSREPLQRFHDGAFKLAVESRKRIIPALMFNTAEVLPRKTFYFWPRRVEMHFLPPVDVDGKTVAVVKEEVFNIMKDYYLRTKDSVK